MSYGEVRVVFFCVGDGSKTVERFGADPWSLLSDKASQAIMLALADRPLTIQEIASETSMEKSELLKELDTLVRFRLVRRVGDRYATCIPVVSDSKAGKLRVKLEGLSKAAADVVEGMLPDVVKAYSKTEISEDLPWRQVAHIVIDALLMDFCFLSYLDLVRVREGLFGGWSRDQLLIPFFGLEVGPNYVNLGVNSSLLNGYGISILHGSFINRPLKAFYTLLTTRELREAVNLTCDKGSAGRVPEELVKLGLVRCVDGFRLAVPLLREGDKYILTKAVGKVAYKVAEELVLRRGFQSVLMEAFSELGYSNWMNYMGDFDEIACHSVMALTVEELIHRRCIPEVPERPPMSWGVWLWERPWTLSFKAIYELEASEVEQVVRRLGELEGVKPMLEEAERLFVMGRYQEAVYRLEEVIAKYKGG